MITTIQHKPILQSIPHYNDDTHASLVPRPPTTQELQAELFAVKQRLTLVSNMAQRYKLECNILRRNIWELAKI
jgi:hypothetical protein